MNRHLLRWFRYTTAALVLVLIVILAALAGDISGFDLPGVASIGIYRIESDLIVMAFLLVIPAFFVDRSVTRQRIHAGRLLAEQLRVLQVTMRTVQDIVNNNLNQLQLLSSESATPSFCGGHRPGQIEAAGDAR